MSMTIVNVMKGTITEMKTKSVVRVTASVPAVVGWTFLLLKCFDVITWPWVYVLAPFWISMLISLIAVCTLKTFMWAITRRDV